MIKEATQIDPFFVQAWANLATALMQVRTSTGAGRTFELVNSGGEHFRAQREREREFEVLSRLLVLV